MFFIITDYCKEEELKSDYPFYVNLPYEVPDFFVAELVRLCYDTRR